MRFKSFEEFANDYYQKGFIDKVLSCVKFNKQLNDKQIRTYYSQYVKKFNRINKQSQMQQSQDSLLSQAVRQRDGTCRLLQVLTQDEIDEWRRYAGEVGSILDAAHVFGKSAYPALRYNIKNIVLLNRFSHSCLDTQHSPLNGKMITHTEKINWWKRIVGENTWIYLQDFITKGK